MLRMILVVAAIGACGDNLAKQGSDAGATSDGAPDGPVARDVIVTTATTGIDLPGDAPVQDAIVVVLRADHSLASMAMTNANGNVVLHDVPDGASVTVVYPDAGTARVIYTVLDVKPGDHLRFGRARTYFNTGGTDAAVTVTVPANGAVAYAADDGCSSAQGGTSLALTVQGRCNGATHGVAARAFDASSNLVATSYKTAPNIADGATITMPAWTAVTANNMTVSVSGVPDTVTSVFLDAATIYPPRFRYEQYANGAPVGGAFAMTKTLPKDGVAITAAAYFNTATGPSQYTVAALDPAATTKDLTTPALPWVDSVSATGAAVSWHVTGAGTPDGGVFFYEWSAPSVFTTWAVVMPPATSSIDLTGVPAPLAQYLPTASDTIDPIVTYFDLASAANYDDVRALPMWQLESPEFAVQLGAQTSVGWSSNQGE